MVNIILNAKDLKNIIAWAGLRNELDSTESETLKKIRWADFGR